MQSSNRRSKILSVICYKRDSPLKDIDIDLAPSKRPKIIREIKKERRQYLDQSLDEQFLDELGATCVATYGTETSKSVVLTACRGYVNEDFPQGIDSDIAQYLSSLIPVERGFNWSIEDVYYGNKEKNRPYVKLFKVEVDKYPNLLNIMLQLEGLIKSRGVHASGIVFFDGDPFEVTCFMRAPNGEVITQFDLHDVEATGATKFDFLITKIQDKITTFIELLQRDNLLPKDWTIRQIYETYFQPDKLPLDDDKLWDAIENNEVLDLFQFDSDVGRQAAKKIKPKNIIELSDANSLLRLMPETKNAETPLDKYVRYKNNIQLWYDEMKEEGLTQEEMKTLEPYFLSSFGVPPSQEQLMLMLMDKNICNFSLAEANSARKIVGKKQLDKIPFLHDEIMKRASRKELGDYIWKAGVGPQMGYSFSVIHATSYSYIGVQSAFAATHWNPIYWNTACLIVNTESLLENNEDEDDEVDIEEKDKSTDYGKLATAIGMVRSRGIKVSLIDINNSDYTFIPDVENNEILFGLKGVSKVNKKTIEQIMAARPYKSIKDFMKKCPLNKPTMISLIKAGAFDKLDNNWAKELNQESRIGIMAYYIYMISEPKTNLNLQNFSSLVKYNLIPDDLEFTKQLFDFNKYIKKNKKDIYYLLDESSLNFLQKSNLIEEVDFINGNPLIQQKIWDKIYSKQMDCVRDWIKENKEELLQKYNTILFKQNWEKYASGTISAWEMQALCFYYHEHELSDIDVNRYGISDFFKLNEKSEVERYITRKGIDIPIYKIHKIVGTVIAKKDSKATITLLTPTGVVSVKFTKEYYSMFKKRISKVNPDGTKTVIEEGWFKKGTLLLINGYRREDTFVAKTYKTTNSHQLYKILQVVDNKNLVLTHERAEGDSDEEE